MHGDSDVRFISYPNVKGGAIVEKPRECGAYACVCLWENIEFGKAAKENSANHPPITCHNFDGKIVFLIPYELGYTSTGTSYPRTIATDYYKEKPDDKFKYFIFGGRSDRGDWKKIKSLYIEKFKQNNKIYVFLAAVNQDIKSRYYELSQNILKKQQKNTSIL